MLHHNTVPKEVEKAAKEAKKVARATLATEATVGKKERGRQRKIDTLEVDTLEAKAKAVWKRQGKLAEAEQEGVGLEPDASVPGVCEDMLRGRYSARTMESPSGANVVGSGGCKYSLVEWGLGNLYR